ncbi:hypothetical protein SLS56_009947 [Neofusicoccum ribis]|uniref:Nephrocystin 3-like N-terminal domain-containing protein n=1 Tax=Neofusicoccum ribis TaxID=45134 RepID=A0ABR3SFT5_9PEZI
MQAFPDQDWHKDGVVTADGTCNWIFSHDTFKHWAADPRQLLWIRGNPGTGKSTMMKHIFQSLDERRSEGQTLATFFFNGRGKEFLTTLLSLYRALLNQILHQSPEHLSELVSKYKKYKVTRDKSWEWSVDELRRYFAKAVPAISAKRHICILVDALDESGEHNARELIEQFEETLAAVNEAGGFLKICFSCRYYPILTLKNGLTITMETENQEDIETFVKKFHTYFRKSDHYTYIADLSSNNEKTSGVFCLAPFHTISQFSLAKEMDQENQEDQEDLVDQGD